MSTAGGTVTARAPEAQSCLCDPCWNPRSEYVRLCRHSPDDAQEGVQDLFAQLLVQASQQKRRFRSFLRMVLKRLLSKERAKVRTHNCSEAVRLWAAPVEHRRGPLRPRTSQHAESRSGVRSILDDDRAATRATELRTGRQGRTFRGTGARPGWPHETQTYASLAVEQDITTGAVIVASRRLRETYQDCLSEEISQAAAVEVGANCSICSGCLHGHEIPPHL
jgi:hypothetical protein